MNGTWNSYITNIIGNGGSITLTNDIDGTPMFFRVMAE